MTEDPITDYPKEDPIIRKKSWQNSQNQLHRLKKQQKLKNVQKLNNDDDNDNDDNNNNNNNNNK